MQNELEKIKQNIETACQNGGTNQLCRDAEFLVAEIERLYKILHDLTPCGSEYCYDADRCVESIREQIATSERIAKQTIRNSRSGWKPIEGAPRDGRKLIAITKDGEADNILPDNDRGVSSEDPSYQVHATHYIEPPIAESIKCRIA